MICSGYHVQPACIDPFCYLRKSELEEAQRETLLWTVLRLRVLRSIVEERDSDVKQMMLRLMERRWSGMVPRQDELVTMEQRMRKLEQENKRMRKILYGSDE